ncbi:MAG TPA: tetratricopeptide repeat protein [Deltaproteobacteria bacterium]|nr:tetratricopeptide repeat protein [Deltaproteobacteria bacterium]
MFILAWLELTPLALAGPMEEGVAALRRGRIPEAEALLLQAVEASPDQVEAWWELGWAAWAGGRFAQAARAWSRVEALRPGYPDLSLWLAAARTRAQLTALIPEPHEVEVSPRGEPAIRIVAAGDTMMGSDLARPDRMPPGDGDVLFDGVRELFVGADLAFVNLEGPLADAISSDKCGEGSSSCYAFRTPTRFAATLDRAGIDVVSLANNHALDLGVVGQQSTMDALAAVGIAHAGRYGDVASLAAGPYTVAVVAAHSGTCCLSVNDLDEVQAAIVLADRDHDLVLFSFHGGAEGADHRHVTGETEIAWGERRGNVRALAHAAVDAGADLVIGHGPHVLRAVEVYRGRLIAYSLGNFLGYEAFGRSRGYGRRTVVVEATLAANGALSAARLHPMVLDDRAVPTPDPSGRALADVRELSAEDLPDVPLTIEDDGTLRWAAP